MILSGVVSRACYYDALDESLTKGKIVVCERDRRFYMRGFVANMKKLGAIGAVIGCDAWGSAPANSVEFPATIISSKDEAHIFSYINSTRS